MSNPFPSDEEVLVRLVREAGDPSVSPDPRYAQTLRATILDRVAAAETVAYVAEGTRKADVIPSTVERTRQMKRIAKLAVAATILVALGILVSWIVIGGGSANIALADVAKALDGLRTATFDETTEVKNPMDGKKSTLHSKSLFLAPSRQRCEMSRPMGSGKDMGSSIMILDFRAMKGLMLVPEQKQAVTVDLVKLKKQLAGRPANMFAMVRQLVREGSSGGGEKVESLGRKEIDGRAVVGFRTRNNMADMTFWADPQTARPVRVELAMPIYDSRGVMSNFRYDMDLDPSLFSLEPPAGYSVTNVETAMPVEEDLVNILRLIAEHGGGKFPPAIKMGKEYMRAVQAFSQSEAAKLMATPKAQKLMKELRAKYGKDQSGSMKEWMKEWMKMAGPLTQKVTQKTMQGLQFYMMLQPENDAHYVGGGVKLGTPDRPIFWYKPTGADKYRVIYADLRVKEATPAAIKDFPKSPEGSTAQTMNSNASVQDEKPLIEMLRIYAALQNGLLPPTLDPSDVESGIKAPLEKESKAKNGKSREAWMKAELMKRSVGIAIMCSQGLGFLRGLKPENDLHYVGGGVKLGTPDRPIFWYKPTGWNKYRVLYADLSIKELTADEVKKLPAAKAK
jgi:outer membrane lipoprotein-sorting protein